jgi:hypothetical protein
MRKAHKRDSVNYAGAELSREPLKADQAATLLASVYPASRAAGRQFAELLEVAGVGQQ